MCGVKKHFNVTGVCVPGRHYMVDMESRIERVAADYVERGLYFTIMARQFGKTTMLYLLEQRLKDDYLVIRLSFEAADELFCSLALFARGLVRSISRRLEMSGLCMQTADRWEIPISDDFPFQDLGDCITALCSKCGKKIVLMIDEVDKSSDNQIFLTFLGLLQHGNAYQERGEQQLFGYLEYYGQDRGYLLSFNFNRHKNRNTGDCEERKNDYGSCGVTIFGKANQFERFMEREYELFGNKKFWTNQQSEN